MKKILLFTFLFTFITNFSFSIIIYRPANNEDMNLVPCYLKIFDMDDNDVTYDVANAAFAFYDNKKQLYNYKNKFYLSGGMIMHLKLQPGKYKLYLYTPRDKIWPFNDLRKEFKSNYYIYDTKSELNVLFVSPTVNENNFYNGGWFIDHKAPKYRGFTIPKQIEVN